MIIATHNAEFHADEVFAVAVLLEFEPTAEVVRARNPQVLAKADVVVDVGGVFDGVKCRFDHHQTGGAGKRANGIPYASAGLVWNYCGWSYIRKLFPNALDVVQLIAEVDRKLFQGIDVLDCGAVDTNATLRVEKPKPSLMSRVKSWIRRVSTAVFGMSDQHREVTVMVRSLSDAIALQNGNVEFEEMTDEAQMKRFLEAVTMAQRILRQVVRGCVASQFWKDRVAESDAGDAVLMLKHPCPDVACGWTDEVCRRSHIQFVVFPASDQQSWRIKAVPVSPGSFEVRKPLPEAWAGKRDDELNAVAGIKDGIFVHPGRWIGGAKSREGAEALARQAAN